MIRAGPSPPDTPVLHRFRRLLPYMARYRRSYAVGAACVLGSVALRLTVPWLVGDGLDEIGRADGTGDDTTRRLVLHTALTIVAVALAAAVVRTASRITILGNSRRAVHDLRADLFAWLLRLPPSFYLRHQVGQVMSRLVNDLRNVQGLTGPVFLYLVETGLLYAVGLFFMVRTDPVLTLWGLLPFPFFLWAAHRLARRIQLGSRAAQERLGDLAAKVDESLSGHRVVRSLALEEHDRASLRAASDANRRATLEVARARGALQPLMVALAGSTILIVLAVGGPRVVAGTTSIGDLFAMILYLGLVAQPTRTLGFVLSSLQRGAAALERVVEIHDVPDTLADPPGDAAGPAGEGRLEVRGLTVRFRAFDQEPHLSGSAPPAGNGNGSGRTVLEDVSFTVEPGETVGVVGAVGSGKSMLLRALARQLEVPPGTVFVDGRDVTAMPRRALREAIGYVPQDPFLFSATLAENVAVGRPGSGDEAVDRALSAARLDRDLERLPAGRETVLGDRGVNLSGGQKQRTAIARAILRRPRILLLDDALSAVDTDTADAILRALEPLLTTATTVLVAHRVATVQRADRILVLHDGRIVEQGTHEELLARDGRYAALHRSQTEEAVP